MKKSASKKRPRQVKPQRLARRSSVTYETARRLALALPCVEEGFCYGTPACRVGGRILMRLKEDGDSLVVLMDFEERSRRLESDPKVFYLTDHYVSYPMVLVRLSAVRKDVLRNVITQAWLRRAPRKLLEAEAPAGAGRIRRPAARAAAPRSDRRSARRRP